jgi:hypothetical protein
MRYGCIAIVVALLAGCWGSPAFAATTDERLSAQVASPTGSTNPAFGRDGVNLQNSRVTDPPASQQALRWSLGILSGGLLVSSVVFGILAWDDRQEYDRAATPAAAAGPSDRFHRDTIATAALSLSCLVSAGALYLLTRNH